MSNDKAASEAREGLLDSVAGKAKEVAGAVTGKDGLVEETASPADVDPRRGAYYRTTPRGRQALARERDRMAALVAAVDAIRAPGRGRRA